MSFLEKNLASIEQIDSELARKVADTILTGDYRVQPAKSGDVTLRIRGLLLHSSYDPRLEARRFVEKFEGDKGWVLVNGFGLGYLPEALRELGFKVVVAEADLNVVRAACESRDISDLLKNTPIFAGKNPGEFSTFLRQHSLPKDIQQLDHGPSVRLNRSFYEYLEAEDSVNLEFASEQVNVPQRLKIFLPSPLYGGSLPIAHYCKRALEELGHQVHLFDSSFYYPAMKSIEEIISDEEHQSKLKGLFTRFVSDLALAKAYEWKPDLVLGIAQSPFTVETLAEYRQLKIPTAFWFMEDFRVLTYWKQFAPLYDHFFVIQRGEFTSQLEQLGVKSHHYLPLAADPEVHKPLNLTPAERAEYGSALSFVGAGYFNRQHLFLQLLDEDFKIWGSDWNPNSPIGRALQRRGERISSEECVKIFNAAKINLNLHSSSYHTGVNPHGDFVNPRTFEIAACGAFQLVDPRSELAELFEVGSEIDTFRDVNELHAKMKYHLEHPEEAKRMASAGKERVLKQHTYKHRMETLLNIVAAREPSIRNKTESPNITRNLIKAAGDDDELKTFLWNFDPEEELTIDGIAQYIRKGKGELTRTEGVFLLMKEFYDWAREKKVI